MWSYAQADWGDGAGAFGESNFMDGGSGNADFILGGSVTANVSDYISPTGEITLLIYDDSSSENTFHDYVAITVHSPSAGCLVDADCDDGAFCNGTETCVSGSCQSGAPVDCDDGVGCTDVSCNEGTDTCDNAINEGNCDDGLFCNGAETCDALLDCQAGAPVDCDDGVACTDDSCNETTDSCDNLANDAICDDGLFCNGAESCDSLLDCQPSGDPCLSQFCDEDTDSCFDCFDDTDCDDGLFCNGAESCVSGSCQAGTSVNCDDGVACTADSCNESTDSCDNAAAAANCDGN